MVSQEQVDAVAAAALPVLRETLGGQVRLGRAELVREGGRNLVVRCALEGGLTSKLVVVKYLLPGQDLGFTDWACLAFLGSVPGVGAVVPRLMGGHVAERVFVMEDLGGSRSMETALESGPAGAVWQAARSVARQSARLHAATVGREGDFLSACASLPATQVHDRRVEAQRWLEGLPKVMAWLDAAGVSVPAGFQASAEEVAVLYGEPGEWLTFTHGDPAPTNTHLAAPGVSGHSKTTVASVPPGRSEGDYADAGGSTGSPRTVVATPSLICAGSLAEELMDEARLLDFEYGGYRHALYDISAWWVLCPLAEALEGAMRTAYREELARTLAPARDASSFHGAWATMVAYRALAALTWIVPQPVFEEDHEHVGSWTARQAVISRAERLHAATRTVKALAPLGEAGASLAGALRERWPAYAGGTRVIPTWGYERDEGAC